MSYRRNDQQSQKLSICIPGDENLYRSIDIPLAELRNGLLFLPGCRSGSRGPASHFVPVSAPAREERERVSQWAEKLEQAGRIWTVHCTIVVVVVGTNFGALYCIEYNTFPGPPPGNWTTFSPEF